MLILFKLILYFILLNIFLCQKGPLNLLKEDQSLDKGYVHLLLDDLSDEDYNELYSRITITLLEQKIFERKNFVNKIFEKEKNSLKKTLKNMAKEDEENQFMKIEIIEDKRRIIEKMFGLYYNTTMDNLNKLPVKLFGDTAIKTLAEFYLMLKSVDGDSGHDLESLRNIINKFGLFFCVYLVYLWM
uniref:Uncharacterized protein n=1 Tax=Meloidogyne enterolobii TaxID=390850 RepID=A0A6V7W2U1_MELEN|nr:unnamed protein product [Meloidogyne enterolobii]